jgi:hypothetical protein
LSASGGLSARTVVLDELARQALDHVCEQWEGGETAWRAIEWVMARDPLVGRRLSEAEAAELRAFQYDGARSIKQPDLYVIYEVLEHEIVVKVIGYDDAKAANAGRG